MNGKRMKRLVLGAGVLGAGFAMPLAVYGQIPQNPSGIPDTTSRTSSQSTPGRSPSSASMQDSSLNGSVSDDVQLQKDRMFVRKAEEGGLAQVQFGQLAQQKASGDDVKKFGQRMVEEHMTLRKDMEPIADSLGVEPPTKLAKGDQDEYNKLSSLSGTDFDKEYLTVMLKDHRKDLHDFRTEQKQTPDPDLQDVIEKRIQIIAAHLYLANKLAVANGVPGAYKAPPPAVPPAPPQN